jgi:hypothetical protein
MTEFDTLQPFLDALAYDLLLNPVIVDFTFTVPRKQRRRPFTVGAATGDPVKTVTKRINSKLVWLSDRQAYFRKAIKVFAPPPAVAIAVAVAAALEQPVIPEKGVEPMRSSAS